MIKINLELPEFENELSISVTLRKDGEVISTSSSTPWVKTEVSGLQGGPETETLTKSSRSKKKSGGNMMDINF